MAQKELAKKNPGRNPLVQIPEKLELLDRFEAEFTHIGYAKVGSVTKVDVSGTDGPLKAGLGAGALKLEYRKHPLFFATPKLEVRGIVGDFELYSALSAPVTFKIKESKNYVDGYATLGGVWESPFDKGRKVPGVRLGMEVEGNVQWAETKLVQHLVLAGFGASVEYGKITAYGIEQIVFTQETPVDLRLCVRHHKAREGLIFTQGDLGAGAEFFQTPFEKGGEVSFTLKMDAASAKLYAQYSKGWDIIGDKAEAGLSIDFGAGKHRVRTRVEGGFGLGGVVSSTDARDYPVDEEHERNFKVAVWTSENLSEFAEKYRGKGKEAILYAMSSLGRYGGENYDHELRPSIKHRKEIKEIGIEGSYTAIRKSILQGTDGGTGTCGNIGALQRDFLDKVGWEAYTVLIPGKTSPHYITFGQPPGEKAVYLANYNHISENSQGKVWPLIRRYATERGVLPHGFYIFGKGNRIIGYYEAEEKALSRAMAGDGDTLKDGLLKSRPKRR
jgi:hypothetical protein